MPKLTLASDDLPAEMPHAARARAWTDQFEMVLGNVEIQPVCDVPFHGRLEAVPLGDVGLVNMRGTLLSLKRSRKAVIADGSDCQFLIINLAPQPFHTRQLGREAVVEAGAAILFSEGEAGDIVTADDRSGVDTAQTLTVRMPRRLLAGRIGTPENHVLKHLGADCEALRLLKAYADALVALGGLDNPLAASAVGAHLVDLVALALGADGDAGQIASERGLKAARLDAILREIARGYANPAFSVLMISARLGLSVRYVQKLLHTTGTSFAERVLELRLQRSCDLLARADATQRKVSDIAHASGFSDLSYFHRSFRRRFGMTPAGARAE